MITSKEYAIEVRNVSKMYKKYKNNFDKILDLLGLSFRKNYEEFWPLKDINLTIKKGEKVGIIGRNGAGKTTLLSMIADNLKPTSGTIYVNGKVNALFVLGTGFHPEFSGRENIKSSLAFQGITGDEALRLEKEIISFSELESFIDQPLKTYSAGMYTRLAFTVATAIKPEILIIDEILGAGDAYFNAKALERMNELTNSGATVLFVSHDLSSVQKICDRCIWIDKGKIREDGKTLDVVKSYSADVRRREELRLLSQNSGVNLNNSDEDIRQLLFRFITAKHSAPQKKGFCIHKISLFITDRLFSEIILGDSMDNSIDQDGYIITNEKINWSKGIKKDGKWCREFKDFGGEYIHAIGVFNIPKVVDENDLNFEIEYFDDFEDEILFEIYDYEFNKYKTIEKFITSNSCKWNKKNIPILKEIDKKTKAILNDIYGTKEIEILNYSLMSNDKTEKYIFYTGEDIFLSIDFVINKNLEKFPYFGYVLFDSRGNVINNFYQELKIKEVGHYKLSNNMKNSCYLKANIFYMSLAFYKEIDEYDNSKPWKSYIVYDRKLEFKIESSRKISINEGLFTFIDQLEVRKI
jgi:lipopolysaccharide transport system ATP-binding protein